MRARQGKDNKKGIDGTDLGLEKEKVKVSIWIPLAVVALGFVATLGVALIGAWPSVTDAITPKPSSTATMQTEEATLSQTALPTPTPVSLAVYDDPSGVFSIAVPSNVRVTSRTLSGLQLQVWFSMWTASSVYDYSVTIDTTPGLRAPADVVADLASGPQSDGRRREVIFNRKTARGYYLHWVDTFQDGKTSNFFLLEEAENGVYGSVLLLAKPEPLDSESAAEIDQIVSSFQWSSNEALLRIK